MSKYKTRIFPKRKFYVTLTQVFFWNWFYDGAVRMMRMEPLFLFLFTLIHTVSSAIVCLLIGRTIGRSCLMYVCLYAIKRNGKWAANVSVKKWYHSFLCRSYVFSVILYIGRTNDIACQTLLNLFVNENSRWAKKKICA